MPSAASSTVVSSTVRPRFALGGSLRSVPPVTPARGSDPGDTARFHFEGVGEIASPSLSSARQHKFKVDFRREIASLEAWSIQQNWRPTLPLELQVFVSDDYKISRSLVPAWLGQRGRLEFSTWRMITGEAAIMHELVHLYFPNANRLLAEGLAVYLQANIGGNPAFPNFGVPLHEAVREYLPEMAPESRDGRQESLEPTHLATLDTIATPYPLALSIGRERYQARIYPIAGSFVQFLIETHGMDKFRALFARTPLAPLECEAGSPERWVEVYGLSLADLEQQWRSLILACAALSAGRDIAASAVRRRAARSRARMNRKALTTSVD
jgi:hypothetical protein